MKPNKVDRALRNLIVIALIMPVIFVCSSCSKKMQFQTSSVVPSAEGSVKVNKNKNNNYSVDLSVIRLANAERLDPPKKMYIVWMNTADNGVQKLGQLKTSSSILSSSLKSSLKTTVPYKPTGFFITAEDNGDLSAPNGVVVLRTN